MVKEVKANPKGGLNRHKAMAMGKSIEKKKGGSVKAAAKNADGVAPMMSNKDSYKEKAFAKGGKAKKVKK